MIRRTTEKTERVFLSLKAEGTDKTTFLEATIKRFDGNIAEVVLTSQDDPACSLVPHRIELPAWQVPHWFRLMDALHQEVLHESSESV